MAAALALFTVSVFAAAFAVSADVYAADEQTAIPEKTGNKLVINDDRFENVQMSEFPYLDTAKKAFTWSFPYSDEFFNVSPRKFSPGLAQGSLGLALSAFRSTSGVVKPQYKTYLSDAGFTDLYAFGYDKPTTTDSLSGIIGSKQTGKYTVIAVVTCGQGYGAEWAGNLKVGSGDVHQGFREAADLLIDHLNKYSEEHNITGEKKLWITGMSRAAAIGNLVAADMIESGDYKSVYAYLFGVPRTTKDPVPYNGIYNICGQFDPVSNMPLQTWGFERHGTDIYTPAQETDSYYLPLSNAASDTAETMTSVSFRNNPEINYQLHLIEEFLGMFFPTSEEYAERFQEIIMKKWKEPGVSHLAEILQASFKQMDDLSKRESQIASVLLNYATYVVGQHMRAQQRQIEDGSWMPFEGLDENIALEHRPCTYVEWLFSDSDPEKIYLSNLSYRRLIFNGDLSLEVYCRGHLIQTIDPDGNVDVNEGSGQKLFAMRNGHNLMICIPEEESYRLIFHTVKEQQKLIYYDVYSDAAHLQTTGGKIYWVDISRGQFALEIDPGKKLPEPEITSGSAAVTASRDYKTSPVKMMRLELKGAEPKYLTLDMIFRITRYTALSLLFLNFISNIVEVIVWRMRRRGHDSRSPDWFVILVLFICICIFTCMTLFLTFYLFPFSKARSMSAAIAIFFVAVMAFRGMVRYKSAGGIAVTIALFLLIPATYRYYYKLPVVNDFSVVHSLILAACMAALSIITIRLCYPGDRIKVSMPEEETE